MRCRCEVGARHNGGLLNPTGRASGVDTKRSCKRSDWPHFGKQAVMLSWLSANSPRSNCQDAAGSMPDVACIHKPCATAPCLDFFNAHTASSAASSCASASKTSNNASDAFCTPW